MGGGSLSASLLVGIWTALRLHPGGGGLICSIRSGGAAGVRRVAASSEGKNA